MYAYPAGMPAAPLPGTSHAPDFSIHRLWAEFRDRELERSFQEHSHLHNLKRLRYTLWYASIAYLALSFVDLRILGPGQDLLFTTLARGVYSAFAFAALYRLSTPRSPAELQWLARTTSALAMLVIIWIVSVLPVLIAAFNTGVCIVIVATLLMLPMRLPHAIVQTSALCALYCVVCFAKHSAPDALVITSVLLALIALCLMGAHEMQRQARQEFRLLLENQRLSIRDHLTDCYNRRYLYEHLLGDEIEKARQARGWLSVVICDIDHFKHINDQHGHQAGDYVLTLFARLLIDTVGESGSVIRHGGEEFLLLLPHTGIDAARATAELLRVRIGELSALDAREQRIRFTASFGAASNNFAANPGTDAGTLITHADQQLYRAKSEGRNRVCGSETASTPSLSLVR